jgi:DNA-binding HxlR family transcriptional regulator
MRSYNQLCPVAKALDAVGDRWNLLIVRELLIRRSCRYTDLMAGIPGISTSVLAERLASLESSGVIAQHVAPPPIATTLYELTEAGHELEPVVVSLGQWGLKHGEPPRDQDQARAHWLPFVVSLKLRDGPADDQPALVCLETPGDRTMLRIDGQRVVILHDAPEPDVTLSGAGDVLFDFLSGEITEDQAAARGMMIQGDATILARLDSSPADRTPAHPSAP